jgi:hypothetical protein
VSPTRSSKTKPKQKQTNWDETRDTAVAQTGVRHAATPKINNQQKIITFLFFIHFFFLSLGGGRRRRQSQPRTGSSTARPPGWTGSRVSDADRATPPSETVPGHPLPRSPSEVRALILDCILIRRIRFRSIRSSVVAHTGPQGCPCRRGGGGLPLGDNTAGPAAPDGPAPPCPAHPGIFDRWRAAAGWVARTCRPAAPGSGRLVPPTDGQASLFDGRFGHFVEEAGMALSRSRPFANTEPSPAVAAVLTRVT